MSHTPLILQVIGVLRMEQGDSQGTLRLALSDGHSFIVAHMSRMAEQDLQSTGQSIEQYGLYQLLRWRVTGHGRRGAEVAAIRFVASHAGAIGQPTDIRPRLATML